MLSGTFFQRADPGKGRFRSFLLGAVKNFLAVSHERLQSIKRGGNVVFLPFDFDSGESNYLRSRNTAIPRSESLSTNGR